MRAPTTRAKQPAPPAFIAQGDPSRRRERPAPGDGRPDRRDDDRHDDAPLLLVNAHYYPDIAATAHHATDLAEHLVREGYSVEVCTSRGKYVAGRVPAPADELLNGVRVRRISSTAFGRSRVLGRIADYASFHVQALRLTLGAKRYRGVIFLTTPPFLSVIGWLGRLLRRRRYAIWSMDLHPEAEIAAGMLRPRSLLGRALVALNARGYRGADFVVALGRYMRELILRQGVDARRVRVVPVWVGEDEVRPLAKADNALVDELGLRDKFVVAYIGNAGLAHDFRDVLGAMRLLRDHPRIQFLFIGDGPRRAEIEAFVREHGLTNFMHRPYYPRERIREAYGVADVHLVTLREPFIGIAVPTKCYVSMATAQPVLFVGPTRCESADALLECGGGVVVDPAEGRADERIAARLTQWCDDAASVRAVGLRARAGVLGRYERQANCEALTNLIREHWGAPVTARSARTTPPSRA